MGGGLQVLTARANWGAEPIRDGGRLAAFRGDEAHKPGRPAETQFEALICKQTKRRRATTQTLQICQLFSSSSAAPNLGGSSRLDNVPQRHPW